ncbi:MAG: ribonuclease HII [bacterium]|nr:ribonuclease HII [Candidatus Colousia faecequi]
MTLKRRYDKTHLYEAGVDEAGRGCLAGDVYAAAVVFPPDYENEEINDSKKLSPRKREQLAEVICQNALAVGVGIATVEEIDRMNILNAAMLAMRRALDEVRRQVPIDFILVDGNRFPGVDYALHKTIVKGDATYLSIAAASIIAKTRRDNAMKALSSDYPCYAWNENAGYPTKKHRDAIRQYGPCLHHRKSFTLLKSPDKDFPKNHDHTK